MTRIATWNVNSVRARLPHVLTWIQKNQPDVLLLQELKCEETAFPFMEFKAAGYHAYVAGQKSYNGVALLSLTELGDVQIGLGDSANDAQARYIEASLHNLRIASVYAPNGNPVDSEKYTYKLEWLDRLHRRTASLLLQEQPFLLGGDFNVIPTELDVYDPEGWIQDALYAPPSRQALRRLCHLGLTDAWRSFHPQEQGYTFWDYQAGAWPMNKGLRIDHFLASPVVADRMISCTIDSAPRDQTGASDHVPVILQLQ